MNKYIIFLIAILFAQCSSKSQENKLTGAEVVNELEKLGFFSLTDSVYLESSKKSIEESYNKYKFFDGELIGESLQYADNRFYNIDCETLYEIGGLTEYLDMIKISFDKLDLRLEYSDETIEQGNDYWKHTIKLNGKEYIAFEGKFSYNDWGIAYVNFVKMLNDQLEIQKSDERFYPVIASEDGRIVLLNSHLAKFVKDIYPNDNEHPKDLEEWMKENKLK